MKISIMQAKEGKGLNILDSGWSGKRQEFDGQSQDMLIELVSQRIKRALQVLDLPAGDELIISIEMSDAAIEKKGQ